MFARMNLENPVRVAAVADLAVAPPVPRPPFHAAGMRIGLFGGTFNPPHEGHRLASLIALHRLGLDRVWWLVTPGNPLKETAGLPSLAVRMAACRRLARHPRIDVSGLEAEIGTRYTYETIAYLRQRCPGAAFVWIMGADNLTGFHRWQRWRDIARLVPIAVIDRPRSTLKAAHSRAAVALSRYRFDESDGLLLAGAAPPAFMFLHGPRSDLSSTILRGNGHRLGAADEEAGSASVMKY
jgi:nicotinate-nucleotide adenylyltransferase